MSYTGSIADEYRRHEFVHRDLKLENIMLESRENYVIKLVDFGFAEKINYKELVSKAGTPGYIPPEIFKNHPYTSKGDIFSMGVIIFSVCVCCVDSRCFKATHRLRLRTIS